VARIAQGKGFHAVPVLTRGLSDRVWANSGEINRVDGCYFQVVGTVEKVKGIRNLVDWDKDNFHLLNTRINAMTAFQAIGGPDELIVSLSGDSGAANYVYPIATGKLLKPGTSQTKDKYRGGRVLLLRGRTLEHDAIPHIAIGSEWHDAFGEEHLGGDSFIAARRADSQDQFDGDYFANWGGWLFISNGVDANLKWDGSYTSAVGVHVAPAAPRTTKQNSPGMHPDFSIADEYPGAGGPFRGNESNAQQKFQYRCTFVNESGAEGPPSGPGISVNAGEVYKEIKPASTDVILEFFGLTPDPEDPDYVWVTPDAVPIEPNTYRAVIRIDGFDAPSQADIVWRNIYKRAKDGEYYFWRQVAVNEKAVYDHENVLDSAAMGTPLVEGRSAPPTSKFVGFFRSRGYYVSTSFPAFVFYSDANVPEQISSPLQYLDVNSADGRPITGLFALGDSLVVFKESSVWQVTSLADGSPVLTPVTESVGSLSPRGSILAYERLLFIGERGVYQYDGAAVRPLSESLNKWWNTVYVDGLKTATSWLDERERRLFISMQSGPGVENDMVVCYHYQLDAVTVTKGQRITASTRYKGEPLLGVRLPEKSFGIPGGDLPGFTGGSGAAGGPVQTVTKKVTNSDIVIWGLGDSMEYGYLPGGEPDPDDQKSPVTVSAGNIAGKIRFGPYSANQTGWNSDEEMEVAGIDVFFPYCGDQSVTVRWYKNRDPEAVGTRAFQLNQHGTAAQKSTNQDLTTVVGWAEDGFLTGTEGVEYKTWESVPSQDDDGKWNGRRQLFQRLVFPETVVCREIEIEFENGNEKEPFMVDGFVLWRASKGSERQR